MKTLLTGLFGSRGRGESHPGSDLNTRSIVCYGDERDTHGPHTEYTSLGTHNLWSLNFFVHRLVRFNFEALEILYIPPRQIVKFHPALLNLFRLRSVFLSHEVLDTLVDRAELLYRRGSRPKHQEKYQKWPKDQRYDSHRIIQAFDLAHACIHCVSGRGLDLQSCHPNEELRQRTRTHDLERSPLDEIWQETIHKFRRLQASLLMAPSKRQVRRGETPTSPIPALSPEEVKKEIEALAQNIPERIDSYEETEVDEGDLLTLDRSSGPMPGFEHHMVIHVPGPGSMTIEAAQIDEEPRRARSSRGR